jgi:hypothetical protein
VLPRPRGTGAAVGVLLRLDRTSPAATIMMSLDAFVARIRAGTLRSDDICDVSA